MSFINFISIDSVNYSEIKLYIVKLSTHYRTKLTRSCSKFESNEIFQTLDLVSYFIPFEFEPKNNAKCYRVNNVLF